MLQVYWGDFGTRKIHKLSEGGSNEVIAPGFNGQRQELKSDGVVNHHLTLIGFYFYAFRGLQ